MFPLQYDADFDQISGMWSEKLSTIRSQIPMVVSNIPLSQFVSSYREIYYKSNHAHFGKNCNAIAIA